jgi:hypothetical protein
MELASLYKHDSLSFVDGIQALCTPVDNDRPEADVKLCSVCLQWTCDGPHCHRPEVCETAQKAALA